MELFIWFIVFSGVILLNLSPQIISKTRVSLLVIFSFLIFILTFDRFISLHLKSLKKNFIRLFFFLISLLIVFWILRFQKNSVWVLYFSPLLLAFSLSFSFVTQPGIYSFLLVAISIFLLGDIYWESKLSPQIVQLSFPLFFVKIFSLSLLAIFGYYLYQNQSMIRKAVEEYNKDLKKLNEELRKKSEELEEANKRLKELSEAKSVFVATVSHELRTPLTAILNSLKLIGYEAPDNEKVKEYIEIIKKNIDRQSIMIDNLLETARLERGTFSIRRTNFELNRLLKEVVETMRPQAEGKKIELNFSPLEGDSSLWGEEEQLRRVFINLVDNAIKFTPQGGKVEIVVNRKGEDLEVMVSDNGCGIPKEEQEKIFEPFVQIERGQSTKRGIGLGLTIVREIVSRHQGRVWVESELNKGSKFFVSLPIDLRKSR